METLFFIILGAETLLLLGVVFVLLDKSRKMTDLFDNFRRLQTNEEEYKKMQHDREDYMAMLVHELRSPLSVIKGSADLIIHEAQNLSQDDITKFLSQIKTSSSSLLSLVNDILDVSKIESGKFEVEKKKASINGLLQEESDSYQTLTNQKKIVLMTELEEDMPEFEFDSERVKQVMNNLISNSIKFTPEGGYIKIISQEMDGSIKICVEDSGEGIPDDLKPKLFHKFVQLHQPGANIKGTGLGLVITKGIVEAHGGHIWIENNEPSGARLCFTLPFKSVD
jgi:signal transduction histidine kinase